MHPDLQAVLNLAIQICPIDFTIVEGARTDEQCYINFGKGRTAAQCIAGGCPAKYAQPKLPKVTWLTKALSSNHRAVDIGDGKGKKGRGVDIYPYPVSLVLNHKSGWEPLFDKIAAAMFEASRRLHIPIRWGANWDLDNMPRERGETDNPHFELKGK